VQLGYWEGFEVGLTEGFLNCLAGTVMVFPVARVVVSLSPLRVLVTNAT
jgi:hypothetical protein